MASATMIAELPELGQLNRREIAALVGVAPMAQRLRRQQGQAARAVAGAEIRRVLYMATLTARTTWPSQAFYERLKAAGRLPKVALVACMRSCSPRSTPWCALENHGTSRFIAPDFEDGYSVDLHFEVVRASNGALVIGDFLKPQVGIQRAGGFHVVQCVQQHAGVADLAGAVEHGLGQFAPQAKAPEGFAHVQALHLCGVGVVGGVQGRSAQQPAIAPSTSASSSAPRGGA